MITTDNFSEETLDILTNWMYVTGEAITALGVEGYPPEKAIKMLRTIITQRNIKYVNV